MGPKLLDVRLLGFDRLQKDLTTFASKAVPYAARNGMNASAFALQDEWRGEVRRSFTLRNQYTVRSIQVDKAQGLDMRRMQAVTGSVAPYMDDQEGGATVEGKSGKKPIPGPAAAGQAPGGKRTRMVRARLRLSSITVSKAPTQGFGKRRANAVAIAIAIRKGERFVMLHRKQGGGRGLFEVTGKRYGHSVSGKGHNAKVKLLYDMSRRSVRVPAAPTLERSIRRSMRRFETAHYQALLFQLRRWKVFNY